MAAHRHDAYDDKHDRYSEPNDCHDPIAPDDLHKRHDHTDHCEDREDAHEKATLYPRRGPPDVGTASTCERVE